MKLVHAAATLDPDAQPAIPSPDTGPLHRYLLQGRVHDDDDEQAYHHEKWHTT